MEASTRNFPADLLRPRSLAVLMGIYEVNYRRLLELLGEPARWSRHFSLHLEGRPVLHVEVKQRARYTVDVVMTHLFDDERLPDLSVRLYSDARLAEAVPAFGAKLQAQPMARLPQRWQANLLLYKWLEYCLDATRPALTISKTCA